jgi:hypothetical protein
MSRYEWGNSPQAEVLQPKFDATATDVIQTWQIRISPSESIADRLRAQCIGNEPRTSCESTTKTTASTPLQ